MSTAEPAAVKQCKSCPWRVGTDPDKDIPGYSRELHEDLRDTIRSGMETINGTLRVMGCHYSTPTKDIPCAGWMANQLQNNNLGLRIKVAYGQMPVPETDGEQHANLECTMPSNKRRRK